MNCLFCNIAMNNSLGTFRCHKHDHTLVVKPGLYFFTTFDKLGLEIFNFPFYQKTNIRSLDPRLLRLHIGDIYGLGSKEILTVNKSFEMNFSSKEDIENKIKSYMVFI